MPISLYTPPADDLYRVRDELVVETADTVAATFDARSLGNINIIRGRGSVRMHLGPVVLTPMVAYQEIGASRVLRIRFDQETDVGLRMEWPSDHGLWEAHLAGNVRAGDDDIVRGQINWRQTLSDRWTATASLWLNEVVDDTPSVRVFGTKDKLAFGLNLTPSRWTSMRLTVDGHRYGTRDGQWLAEGYRIDGVLEENLLLHAPWWSIRLQGSWEENTVARQLEPATVQRYFDTVPVVMSNIVSPEFGTLGAGTTVRWGTEGLTWRPYVVADAWVGMLWPSSTLAYSTTLGVAVSFMRRDKLSINLFHANTQGGQSDSAYEGVGLTYSYLF